MSGTNRLFILHAKPQALTPCFQAAVCVLLSAVLLLLRMENLSGVAKLAAFPVIPWHGKMGVYFSCVVPPCLLWASGWGQVAKTTLWDLFPVLPHAEPKESQQRVECGARALSLAENLAGSTFSSLKKLLRKKLPSLPTFTLFAVLQERWKKLCCLIQRSPWSTRNAFAAAGNTQHCGFF